MSTIQRLKYSVCDHGQKLGSPMCCRLLVHPCSLISRSAAALVARAADAVLQSHIVNARSAAFLTVIKVTRIHSNRIQEGSFPGRKSGTRLDALSALVHLQCEKRTFGSINKAIMM